MEGFADFVVHSPDDRIQLVVEVKSMNGASDEWAAKMRRNLLAHSMIPRSRFFLLALPEFFYLWRDNIAIESVPADYKVRARDALSHYVDDIDLEELSEPGFELLISSWLNHLVSSRITKDAAPELSWVFDSGLYESINGGSVETETAA